MTKTAERTKAAALAARSAGVGQKEAARGAGVHPSTLRRWERAGEVPADPIDATLRAALVCGLPHVAYEAAIELARRQRTDTDDGSDLQALESARKAGVGSREWEMVNRVLKERRDGAA